MLAAYGQHRTVRDWVARIPTDAPPHDPNLTSAVFAYRAALVGFALTADTIIARARQIAAAQGRQDALDLVAALTDSEGLDVADGGDAGGGSSLDQLALDAPHRLAAALMSRLGLGGLAGAAGAVITAVAGRALLTSRQAIIDAYRQAQSRVFGAAPDVSGWIWTSQLSANTCGFCYAMHGTWHPDSDALDSHPACQCLQEPSTLSAAEYAQTDPTLGTDLFAALDPAAQRSILGPGRHALYEHGMSLQAMVGDRSLLPLRDLRAS